MYKKPQVLIFIDWFTPAFKAGGPIKSVSNIIATLSNDFEFYVVTSDRDINDVTPFDNIKFNTFIKEETYTIIYLSPGNRDSWIKNHLSKKKYDAYYFNSLFSINFTIKPLFFLNKFIDEQKVIIAPRGMFSEGGLAIKPIKKKLFFILAKTIGLFRKVTWHATNIEEKNDIESIIGSNQNIIVASNISNCEVIQKEIKKEKGTLKLVFFSRISPIKNLSYALNLMKGLENVTLDIYGSIEDKLYWSKCNNFINANNIKAKYKGEILPKDVTTVLSSYHFFILPTLNENFGHAIIEALTAGCGLIISNNTPWRNLEVKNIGWDINLIDEKKFIDIISYCTLMEQDEYNKIRNNCYNFVTNQLNHTQDIINTRKIFIKNTD